MQVQPALSAIGCLTYQDGHFDIIFVWIVHSNIILQRELNICAHSEARACALLMSARTNLLTAHTSLHPLALKCLNRQSLHEFSLNTDINVGSSGLSCARVPSAPGWWRKTCSLALNKSEWFVQVFFITVVVMYWQARMGIINRNIH